MRDKMFKRLSLISLLLYTAVCTSTSTALYRYVGFGLGPQSILYTHEEKQLVFNALFDDYARVKVQPAVMKKFLDRRGVLESKKDFEELIQSQIKDYKQAYVSDFWNEWHKAFITLLANFRFGLAYHLTNKLSAEIGYVNLYSQILRYNVSALPQSEGLSYLDQTGKHFMLHGIQIIGKGKLSLNKKWRLFGQLGGGGYIGFLDCFQLLQEKDEDNFKKLMIQRHLFLPLSPGLIIGGGLQYAFTSKNILEIGWTHTRIQSMIPLNLCTVNFYWL
jgi:hypothetical protein